jgi:branched-chain amino acid transport system substrate-binding protein
MGFMLAQGIEWKVKEINSAGGINGRPIKLIQYDSKADVQESISAFNRLVSTDHAAVIIGPHPANINIALTSITNDAKVPMFSIVMDDRALRQDDGKGEPFPYMFSIQPSCFQQAAISARYAMETKGQKKFGVLYNQSNAFSMAMLDGFKSYVEAHGGQIVSSIAYQASDRDYKTMLNRIVAANVDAIFIPGYLQELVLSIQQARALGYEGTILGNIEAGPPFNTQCGEAANGVVYVNNITESEPQIQDLTKQYREANGGKDPINKFFLGYDLVGGIEQAIKTMGKSDTESIRQGLETLKDYQGMTGIITMSPTAHQPIGLGMSVFEIENGQNVPKIKYPVE